MKSGWRGASNIFEAPMNKSIQNAMSIVTFHQTILNIHKSEGAWQQVMFDDFDPLANDFLHAKGTHMGNYESQKAQTKFFVSAFKEMKSKLDHFDTLTRQIHAVNSDEYKMIWGKTRYRFYHGSYQIRLIHLLGLAQLMTAQEVPLGADAVMEYHDSIAERQQEQQNYMSKSDSGGIDINALRNILIKKLNKNRNGLMYFLGDENNCESLVKTYFPLNLLGNHSMKGHHQLIVPKRDFRRVAIHIFKEGEKIKIVVYGSDVWIYTADSAKRFTKSGYRAINGETVIIDPSELGDLSKKFIMATNDSNTASCNLIFNILKPKAR